MSLTPTIQRSAVVAGIVGLALIGGGLAVGVHTDTTIHGRPLRTPTKDMDFVDPDTPDQSSVAVSSRLFASAPVVVVADPTNVASQDLAITAATKLAVPVLVDGPSTAAEVERLGAESVLTFGKTRTFAKSRPVTRATAAREIARAQVLRPQAATPARHLRRGGQQRRHGAALTTAKAAGATVLAVPRGDPRTVPSVAKALSAKPKAPVIALGKQPSWRTRWRPSDPASSSSVVAISPSRDAR